MLKARKFHQPTANRFSTARKKPVGGTMNMVKRKTQPDRQELRKMGPKRK